MKKVDDLRSSMSVNIIGVIVLLLALFGVIVSALGFFSFTEAFKNEYSTTTYHMADTAASLVNGDHLDDYLAGKETEEYQETKALLEGYCQKMNVSLIYVIQVDTGDYGRFVSIFNQVNNAVDDSSYTEWELGFKRDTTNQEYRKKYRAMYEQTAPYETVYRNHPTDGQHPHITTMVPVKDSSGRTAAILCIQRPIRELNEARQPYLVDIALSVILLAAMASAFITSYLNKHFVEPVRTVSEEAVRFARENTKGEELGGISKFEELAKLAESIDTMETEMVDYMANLAAAAGEKERIQAELSFARNIQENSVPNSFPAFPDRTDLDIFASMTPAKEVGGDFYNFFLIDEKHLAMVIGDVSGKGIPAALFMMVTNILISDRTMMGGSPGEILSFVNNGICEHNRADMFVTLWLGILDLSTGRLSFANAGHDDAAICSRDGEFRIFRTKHNLVAGAMAGQRYKTFETVLKKGDKLFLYTDGVPEATDGENRMFTVQRMLSALNEEKEGTPRELLERVRRSVDLFVGDAPQFDDLTMLCLEWKGENT